MKHGLLATGVVLRTDEARTAFQELLKSCIAEFSPEGLLELFFVEEIATLIWKIQIALRLETQELSRREDVQGVEGVFNNELELPIDGVDLPLDRSWECERLVVRAITGTDEKKSDSSRGPLISQGQVLPAIHRDRGGINQQGRHLEFEAVLGSALEKMARYQAGLKTELYRAIETLRAEQAAKRKRNGTKS